MMLFARYEPTTDKVLIELDPKAAKRKRDVQLYKDYECTQPYARFMWGQKTGKPTRRDRHVTVNGYRWKLQWVD